MNKVITTNSEAETREIGRRIGELCKGGTALFLRGDLGVGKTAFTKGFAVGMGITEPVNSPTFTIVQVYESGRLPLYHFDAYRIGDVEEMEEIGYEEYFYGNGVCLIEWAELIRDILPDNGIDLLIEKDLEKGFDFRRITLTGNSENGNGTSISDIVSAIERVG